ncbi:hypothetical protein CYMTET_45997 [Cymbomonas tetramitiformis]|uniref:Uncharacterized protein n=1 Tax=Cymbomonas tetramitiformis TaxID=36881 RepID=A0AAE0BX27_9CHLO|nr:hypothetical protein CYMTET_45997 [Cymbomonas tetramitiformis]
MVAHGEALKESAETIAADEVFVGFGAEDRAMLQELTRKYNIPRADEARRSSRLADLIVPRLPLYPLHRLHDFSVLLFSVENDEAFGSKRESTPEANSKPELSRPLPFDISDELLLFGE